MTVLPLAITPGVSTGHDPHHEKIHSLLTGPTHYNVEGRTEATFDLRWAAALAEADAAGGGVLVIPPGAYTSAGLDAVSGTNHSKISVLGPGGSAGTVITRSGGTRLMEWGGAVVVTQQGSIKGITLRGDATAAAKGLVFTNTVSPPWLDDVVIENFTGTGAIGLDMVNTTHWTERAGGVRVWLNNNTVSMKMTGGGTAATNSFMYHNWLDLRLNMSANQIGIVSAANAFVSKGKWHITANIDGNDGVIIDVTDTSWWQNPHMIAQGEQTTGTGGIGVRVAAGANFYPVGWIDFPASSGHILQTGFAVDGRILTQLAFNPVITMTGAAAGTSPPAPVLLTGNSAKGRFTVGTGTGPTAGDFVRVTYERPALVAGGNIPLPVIDTTSGVTAALDPFISAIDFAGFTIAVRNAPAASQANTIYGFTYHVTG